MNTHFANSVQIVTAITVLIGLGLVIWELRQTRTLVRAQLASENFASGAENSRVQLSETFARVRAKACLEPEKLTDGELIEMYEYHNLLLGSVGRYKSIQEIAGFDYSWRELAKADLEMWLESKVGRVDYELSKDMINPQIREVAEQLINNGEVENCEEFYKPYFDLVRSSEDPRT